MAGDGSGRAQAVRIDKLLWFLRLSPSRSLAQQWVLAGQIRLNGRRVVKPSAMVATGDILTLPMRTHVRVIELRIVPHRRGPASEAQACFADVAQSAVPGASDSQGRALP